MLALGIRYLTGYAVATDVAHREQAEWPPHPARVYMAMTAAVFETGEDAEERAALEWLEEQPPPALHVSGHVKRKVVQVYVPVNDTRPEDLKKNKTIKELEKATSPISAEQAKKWRAQIDKNAKSAIVAPTAARLALFDAISNTLDSIEDDEEEQELRAMLSELHTQIQDTDIKNFEPEALAVIPRYRPRRERTLPSVRPHSDSLFLLWRDADPSDMVLQALNNLCRKVTRIGHSASLVQMWVETNPPEATLLPADFGELRLRVPSDGALAYLEQAFNGSEIEEYAHLKASIEASKGTERKQLIQECEKRFGDKEPVSLRPVISTWQAYRRVTATTTAPAKPVQGAFDRELLIFSVSDGPVIGLESTWRLMTCMHKTMLEICDPTPEWISGHTAAGKPSDQPHVACLPLAFVAAPHADGHLLGIGLAIPRDIDARKRGQALGKLLINEEGMPRELTLRAGRLGKWTLIQEARPSPPVALRSATWTGPSDIWATVTPIALDRHPKTNRRNDREGWSREVAEIIADSCVRQGLPRPSGVDVDKTAWHLGAPRAARGKSAGYPLMPVKEGQHARQQIHAWLRFDQPVEGPLLLGAGRYRGYGLCRPWERKRR